MRGANRDLLTSINWPCMKISRWYCIKYISHFHVEKAKYTEAQRANIEMLDVCTYIYGSGSWAKLTMQYEDVWCNYFDTCLTRSTSPNHYSRSPQGHNSSIFTNYSAITCFVGNILHVNIMTLSGHWENIIISCQKLSYRCPTVFHTNRIFHTL